MAYEEYFLEEGSLLEDFASMLEGTTNPTSTWETDATFYKIVFPASFIHPDSTYTADSIVGITVAKHLIMKNTAQAFSKSRLGVVITGEFSPRWGDIPSGKTPCRPVIESNDTIPDANITTAYGDDSTGFIGYVKDYIEEVESMGGGGTVRFFNTGKLYFYMAEASPEIGGVAVPDDEWTAVAWSGGTAEQWALDIEVWKSSYKTYNTSHSFVIRSPQLNMMQSPSSRCILRHNALEDFYSETYGVVQNQTNWWADSEISCKGYIGNDGLFLILQADVVPAWEDNIIPSIPLYFGEIDPFSGNDVNDDPITTDGAIVYFAGTMPEETLMADVPEYDFDDYAKAKFQDLILPILKTYPRHPSNGIDTVMVQKSKKGGRYQASYLSWNTTSNSMRPDRMDKHATDFTDDTISRDYPRAWNQANSDEYDYWFNPSRYSKKLHTSKIYVVHPEEGIRGSLKYLIGLSPVGITSGKIRVLTDPCGSGGTAPTYEYYRYHVCDGASPMTKRPGTRYRPIGLGIKE